MHVFMVYFWFLLCLLLPTTDAYTMRQLSTLARLNAFAGSASKSIKSNYRYNRFENRLDLKKCSRRIATSRLAATPKFTDEMQSKYFDFQGAEKDIYQV